MNLCDVILDVCLQTKGYIIVIHEIPTFPTKLWESPSQEGRALISSGGFYSPVIQGGHSGSPAGLPHILRIYLKVPQCCKVVLALPPLLSMAKNLAPFLPPFSYYTIVITYAAFL